MIWRAFGVCLVGLAALQQGAAPQQPVFRTAVDYVELDVVVTDKNDKPVKDLTRADFIVTERGRKQDVSDFVFVSVPPTRRVVDVKAASPTVDVVSNAHSPLGRQWVLVIDDLHIYEQHIVRTKRVIQDFLEQLSKDDQVAIVFVGRSDLSQDFTSDLGAQMRTVNRIKDALGFAQDPPENMPSLDGMGRRARCAERLGNARGTAGVLENISAALVRSTFSRRALVYVSQGFDYDFNEVQVDLRSLIPGSGVAGSGAPCPNEDTNARDFRDRMVAAFVKARQAGVPVYTVDPRGVATPDDAARHGANAKALRLQIDSLRMLADNTGGRAFVSRNMDQAIPELIEDNSSFYLLGYYPNPSSRDGKFHDVEVSVTQPGMRVRAKAGYVAPASATTVAESKQSLEQALGAALPVAGLSLRAFAAPVAASPRGMKVAVTVEVTYPAPLNGAKIDDELQFGLVAIDRDGAVKATTRRAFHFSGSAPRGEDTVTFAVNDTIDVTTQPLTLRIGASSLALGKAGTLHMPLEVINPQQGRLQISTIVIGLAGPVRQAAVPPGALGTLVPFQPTTTRTFKVGETLRVFAPLFWQSKDQSAQVVLTIRRGNAVVSRIERTVSATGSPMDDHREAAFETTVPLGALGPDQYLLVVQASQPGGRRTERAIAFEVR